MSIVHVDETRHVRTCPVLAIHPITEHGNVLLISWFEARLQNGSRRLFLAVQRPSSLNASGLIVDGRSSTHTSRPIFPEAAT